MQAKFVLILPETSDIRAWTIVYCNNTQCFFTPDWGDNRTGAATDSPIIISFEERTFINTLWFFHRDRIEEPEPIPMPMDIEDGKVYTINYATGSVTETGEFSPKAGGSNMLLAGTLLMAAAGVVAILRKNRK